MQVQKTIVYFITMFIISTMIIGCAPKEFSTSEKLIYTTFKTLNAAKEFRHLGLSAIGDFYKQGLVKEATKAKAIVAGDFLKKKITSCLNALEKYKKYSTEDNKRILMDNVKDFESASAEFNDIVLPYMMKTSKQGGVNNG